PSAKPAQKPWIGCSTRRRPRRNRTTPTTTSTPGPKGGKARVVTKAPAATRRTGFTKRRVGIASVFRVLSVPARGMDTARRAARAAARIVREGFGATLETVMKGEVDPVTQIDQSAERAIMDILTSEFPDDRRLGEEGGGSDWRAGRVWIVDPLDGTVNFVHHVPYVSVSIALWEDGAPLVGAVYGVARQAGVGAGRGRGATLNGELIRVTGVDSLSDAMI